MKSLPERLDISHCLASLEGQEPQLFRVLASLFDLLLLDQIVELCDALHGQYSEVMHLVCASLLISEFRKAVHDCVESLGDESYRFVSDLF